MPTISRWLRLGAASAAMAASTYGAIPAHATDVIAEWSTIQLPPTHVEAGGDRPQKHGTFVARLHDRKLRPASALRRCGSDG